MLSFYYLNIMINELDKSVCSTQIVPKAFLDTYITLLYGYLPYPVRINFYVFSASHQNALKGKRVRMK